MAKDTQISFRCDEKTKLQLIALATKQMRSQSNLLEVLIQTEYERLMNMQGEENVEIRQVQGQDHA